ncbi:MAG TPA: ATP-binding protein [bacterium]|nr:ATP-binding protein [bacterium]
MVFITGPRQVGKTWLARKAAERFKNSVYLNYDSYEDRKIIKKNLWMPDVELIIFDEIHKMQGWKNYIKGVYDTKPENQNIIVTGSAGLDFMKHSGDSLAGRYFRHRLLPLGLAELPKDRVKQKSIEQLMKRGGFPEPFTADDDIDADRWRMQYIDGIIRTDILDFEKIHDFKAIQTVLDILRHRVGSPISYSSIAEDCGIASNTVKKYIQIFEALFIVFRVVPHSKNIARSLLKEPKIYFYDTGMVIGDKGAVFENFVAVSLLKHIYGLNDYKAIPAELKYIRTKDGREVDFCITEYNKPTTMIECKYSDDTISSNLFHFEKKYGIPAIQLVYQLRAERFEKNVSILKADKYLTDLFL